MPSLRQRNKKIDYKIKFADIGDEESDREDEEVLSDDENYEIASVDEEMVAEDEQLEAEIVSVKTEESENESNAEDSLQVSDVDEEVLLFESNPVIFDQDQTANGLMDDDDNVEDMKPIKDEMTAETREKLVKFCKEALQQCFTDYTNSPLNLKIQGGKKTAEFQKFDKILSVLAVTPDQSQSDSSAQVKPSKGKKKSTDKTDAQETRYACPLPGCDKQFKVLPSFKYHIDKSDHSINSLIQMHADKQMVNEIMEIIQHQNLKDAIILNDIDYYFQDHPTVLVCDISLVPDKNESRTSSSSGSKKSRGSNYKGGLNFNPLASIGKIGNLQFSQKFSNEVNQSNSNISVDYWPNQINSCTKDKVEKLVLDQNSSVKIGKSYLANNGGCLLTLTQLHQFGTDLDKFVYVACSGKKDFNFDTRLGVQSSGTSIINIWQIPISLKDDILPKLHQSIEVNVGSVLCLKYYHGLLWIIGSDGSLNVIRLNCQYYIKNIYYKVHKVDHLEDGTFTCLDFFNNGLIVAGDSLGQLSYFSINFDGDMQCLFRHTVHDCAITSVCFKYDEIDNIQVLSTSYEGRLVLTNINDQSRIFLLKVLGYLGKVLYMAESKSILFQNNDYQIKLMHPSYDNMSQSVTEAFKNIKITQHKSPLNNFDYACIKNHEPHVTFSSSDGRVGYTNFSNTLKYWAASSKQREKNVMRTLFQILPYQSEDEQHGICFVNINGESAVEMKNLNLKPDYVPIECQTSAVLIVKTSDQQAMNISITRSGFIRVDYI